MKSKNKSMKQIVKEYSTIEYAKKIKKSRQWVHRQAAAGILNARMIGKRWVISCMN